MRKQKLSGSERDWVSKKARKLFRWERGIGKWLKRCMNRRQRKQAKEEIQEQGDD